MLICLVLCPSKGYLQTASGMLPGGAQASTDEAFKRELFGCFCLNYLGIHVRMNPRHLCALSASAARSWQPLAGGSCVQQVPVELHLLHRLFVCSN